MYWNCSTFVLPLRSSPLSGMGSNLFYVLKFCSGKLPLSGRLASSLMGFESHMIVTFPANSLTQCMACVVKSRSWSLWARERVHRCKIHPGFKTRKQSQPMSESQGNSGPSKNINLILVIVAANSYSEHFWILSFTFYSTWPTFFICD